jgi:hypothetical protein
MKSQPSLMSKSRGRIMTLPIPHLRNTHQLQMIPLLQIGLLIPLLHLLQLHLITITNQTTKMMMMCLLHAPNELSSPATTSVTLQRVREPHQTDIGT